MPKSPNAPDRSGQRLVSRSGPLWQKRYGISQSDLNRVLQEDVVHEQHPWIERGCCLSTTSWRRRQNDPFSALRPAIRRRFGPGTDKGEDSGGGALPEKTPDDPIKALIDALWNEMEPKKK